MRAMNRAIEDAADFGEFRRKLIEPTPNTSSPANVPTFTGNRQARRAQERAWRKQQDLARRQPA